jgi:hypothetical protein
LTSDLLLQPVYDLDTGAEIVDTVAVDMMATGRRKVASTETERIAAIHVMVQAGHGVRVAANRIGISIYDAKALIRLAGYDIVPDPLYKKANGSAGNRHMIVRVAA